MICISSISNYLEEKSAAESEIVDCIEAMMTTWNDPSQVQKSMLKDLIRILISSSSESSSTIDILLLTLQRLLHLIKDPQRTVINPMIYEVFGSLLNFTSTFDRVSSGKGSMEEPANKSVKGSAVYDYFVDRLMACRWKAEHLIQMMEMFRELKDLNTKRIQDIVDKVISLLPSMKSEDTPALLYQLLIFGRSSAASGHCEPGKEVIQSAVTVFNGIIGYFGSLEAMGQANAMAGDQEYAKSEAVRQLESQCANHIVLALKHNHWLALELLKLSKRLAKGLMPRFLLMILLSMTGSFKFASSVPALIKSNILVYLRNVSVFELHGGTVEGLEVYNYDRLEKLFKDLVASFSFESEPAIKSLIHLSLDMLQWTHQSKQYLLSLSSVILSSLFTSHPYARKEIVFQIIEYLTLNDQSLLGNLLDQFSAKEGKIVVEALTKRLLHLPYNATWPHLAAILLRSDSQLASDTVRRLLLSPDDDMVSLAISSILNAYPDSSKNTEIWRLIRFAIDRLGSKPDVFLLVVEVARISPEQATLMLDYINQNHLLPILSTNEWPETVTNSVDINSGSIKIYLPGLLLSLLQSNEQIVESLFKTLIVLLDNSAGVRWFAEDECSTSQDLKRPVISDIYEVAIVASLLQTNSTNSVARSFRLYNRFREFQNSTTTGYKSSLKLPVFLVNKLLEILIEDNLQTHGVDDLFKWCLEKLSNTGNSEHDIIDSCTQLLKLIVSNEAKLKSVFSPLLIFLKLIQTKLPSDQVKDTLKWAIEQRIPSKEVVSLIQLNNRHTSENDKLLMSINAGNDNGTAKQLCEYLLTGHSMALQAAKDCAALLGEIDAEGPDENSFGNENSLVKFKFINRKNAQHMVTIVLNWIMEEMVFVEWILKETKLMHKDDRFHKSSINTFCKALKGIVHVQVLLTRTAISGIQAERLQLSLQKTYRISSLFCAFIASLGKTFDLEPLQAVFGLITSELSPNIYTMIPLVQQLENEKLKERLSAKKLKKTKSGTTSTGAGKSRREAKLLPGLIFNIELFDKHILDISRKNNIVLVNHIYRSTARDFRIQTEELEAAMQNFQLATISDASESEDQPALEMPEPSENSTTIDNMHLGSSDSE